MSTADNLDRFEQDFNRAELVPGDTLFRSGRVEDWDFIGIFRTNIGVSYYVVTGNENPAEYEQLVFLIS